jgi:hypothetical protein
MPTIAKFSTLRKQESAKNDLKIGQNKLFLIWY